MAWFVDADDAGVETGVLCGADDEDGGGHGMLGIFIRVVWGWCDGFLTGVLFVSDGPGVVWRLRRMITRRMERRRRSRGGEGSRRIRTRNCLLGIFHGVSRMET